MNRFNYNRWFHFIRVNIRTDVAASNRAGTSVRCISLRSEIEQKIQHGLASRYNMNRPILFTWNKIYHQETYRFSLLTFSILWNETRNEREVSVDASTIKRPVLRLSDSEPRETFFISASWTSGGREWSGDTCARNLEHVSRVRFDDDDFSLRVIIRRIVRFG